MRLWCLSLLLLIVGNSAFCDKILFHSAKCPMQYKINDFCYSPDGKKALVIAGSDLDVWDLESGKKLSSRKISTKRLTAMEPCGNDAVLIADRDGNIIRWSLKTNTAAQVCSGSVKNPFMITLSKDSARLLVVGKSALEQWDVKNNKRLNRIAAPAKQYMVKAIYSPDEKTLYVGYSPAEKVIWQYELKNNKVIRKFDKNLYNTIRDLSFSDDGKRLLVSNSYTFTQWDMEKLEPMIKVRSGACSRLRYLPNNDQLIGSQLDGSVKIWDAKSGKLLKTMRPNFWHITKMRLSPDRKRVLTYAWDRIIRDTDINTGKSPLLWDCHMAGVTALGAWRENRVLSASDDKVIKLWDTTSWKVVRNIVTDCPVTALDANSNADSCIVGFKNSVCRLYDIASGTPGREFKGHCGFIYAVKLLNDNKRFVSCAGDGSIVLWDIDSGKIIHRMCAHRGGVLAMSVSADNKIIASAGRDGFICLWDLNSGKLLKRTLAHRGRINSIAYSHDNKTLLTVGQDGWIAEWDAAALTQKQLYKTVKGSAVAVYSAGDKHIFSSTPNKIDIWSRNSRSAQQTLSAHTQKITDLCLDGNNLLLAASRDATISAWNVGDIRGEKSVKAATINYERTILLPRTLKWEDEAKLEKGQMTVGAEHNPTGNPIGGAKGYNDFFEKGDFTVRSLDELQKFLKTAKAQQIIFIPGDVQIDLSNLTEPLEIPEQVTLAGTRGLNGSPGALIFSDKLRSNNQPLLKSTGDYIRITGLRIKGPHPDRTPVPMYVFGIVINHFGAEIDNCEISGFATSAININNADRVYIHHNYIHHNQRRGLGYGIQLNAASVLVEANIFDWGRHYVASGGYPGSAYEARYNVTGLNAIGHAFDVHGMAHSGVDLDIGGDWLNIHHNTFELSKPAAYDIGIRGKPSQGGRICNNKFANPDSATTVFAINGSFSDRAVRQVMWYMMPFSGESNTFSENNLFGDPPQKYTAEKMIYQALCYRSSRFRKNKSYYLWLPKEEIVNIAVQLLENNKGIGSGLPATRDQLSKLSWRKLVNTILTIERRIKLKKNNYSIKNIDSWR